MPQTSSLQSDLERLDLSKAEIFFRPGSVTKAGLKVETYKRITAGMQDQFGWQLDECKVALDDDHTFLDVEVTSGRAVGKISFEIPAGLEIL